MTERKVIRGGTVISMDRAVGDLERGDILIEGNKIARIAPQIEVSDAKVIDAAGMIVMPGFIDTHHHLFYTALRSVLPTRVRR
jgi:cytosine/adenosine deaminase-related metal-dependent hydrolase